MSGTLHVVNINYRLTTNKEYYQDYVDYLSSHPALKDAPETLKDLIETAKKIDFVRLKDRLFVE